MKNWIQGVLAVLKRNFLFSKYTWLITFVWTFIEPLLYLAAIGYGLGTFIPEIQGQSYLDFYFPGLIAITTMFVPFFESTYSFYSKLTYEKTYQTILLSPISVHQILWGEVLWASFKGFFSGFGVGLIGIIIGVLNWSQLFACSWVIFLMAFVFSALGMFFTTLAKNYDFFYIVFSGLVLPMSLFSDTYYPIIRYPEKVQWALKFLPSVHGVSLIREFIAIASNEVDATAGFSWIDPIIHVSVLLVFASALMFMSFKRFNKILLN